MFVCIKEIKEWTWKKDGERENWNKSKFCSACVVVAAVQARPLLLQALHRLSVSASVRWVASASSSAQFNSGDIVESTFTFQHSRMTMMMILMLAVRSSPFLDGFCRGFVVVKCTEKEVWQTLDQFIHVRYTFTPLWCTNNNMDVPVPVSVSYMGTFSKRKYYFFSIVFILIFPVAWLLVQMESL